MNLILKKLPFLINISIFIKFKLNCFENWLKRTHLGLNEIISGIGLFDTTPSGGDIVNTSSTERVTKRSGPLEKYQKIV